MINRTPFLVLLLTLFAGIWWVACQSSDRFIGPEAQEASLASEADAARWDTALAGPNEGPHSLGVASGGAEGALSSFSPATDSSLPQNLSGTAAGMVAELVALADLSNQTRSPQVVLNVAHSQKSALVVSNEAWFANRLRVELNRAANGRIFFIDPFLNNLEKGRNLKGADFRLEGLVSLAAPSGAEIDLNSIPVWQIRVRMATPDSKESFWTGSYEFQERL